MSEKRPVKRLEASRRSGNYIKQDFMSLGPRVKAGEPMILTTASVPVEIFRAMDIPYVFEPWFMGVVNAKQMGGKMYGYLKDGGYRDDVCSYCSMGLACSFDPNPEDGPWGGLPRPTIIMGGTDGIGCSCFAKLDELKAERFGAKLYSIQQCRQSNFNMPDNWWEKSADHWEDLIPKDRLDHYENEVRLLVEFLEMETGRKLDKNKFIHVLNNVNEQERYNKKVRDLVAKTKPTPAVASDTINAVQQAQWLRGSDWAVEHARLFAEEVQQLVDKGYAAIPNERVRLMWIGRGLWHSMNFYQHFEEKYGAGFIWTMYLGLAADGYPRHNVEENPFRNVAARVALIEEFLHNPKCVAQWYVNQAITHQIDGVVYLVPENCMANGDLAYNIINELESAKIPVCVLRSDPADAKQWSEEEMVAIVEDLIENRIMTKNQ
ncbi:MAG: 2-hydroxyacyl-CoA dehydratase family protein [Clostridiales bacterium]|nr:2-hydroxyacyl-CoA dehydratase family protein [Clostridiales bacterium]